MESKTFEETSKTFRQITIDDNPGSEKYHTYTYRRKFNQSQPILPRKQPNKIDFGQYVKENCKNKFRILNRETFHQIEKPIIIFFNHFRERCVHHTKWLDEMYALALKYSDNIEFIAADMIDMDIIYPGRNPINFFWQFMGLEDKSPNIYAIDVKKRIYRHFDAYETTESLSELCENLLNGKLFLSLPIPENNDSNLVKICVHHNYDELVLKSTKNIFLYINLDEYPHTYYDPNLENVAMALKDYNLDIIYMQGEKNYIPLEYNINYYPTILYIPYNEKNNFVYYDGLVSEADIIEFLKNILEKPEFLKLQQQTLKSKILSKFVKVPKDFQIEFENLPQFLENNFGKILNVLDRQRLATTNDTVILIFMDFQGKCLEQHVEWLNKIYQVAEAAYAFKFFIADFKDIDVINTKWHPKDSIKASQGKPRIFALDRLKHTYEFGNFVSLPSLFYFAEGVQNGYYYYSQLYSRNNLQQAVKEWTADYFQIFLKKSKKNIFITFYSSDDEKSEQLLNELNCLAEEVKDLNVEVATFDIKWNYVDLEYAQASYPAQYFISKQNKRESKIYNGNCLDRREILEFIRKNIKNI